MGAFTNYANYFELSSLNNNAIYVNTKQKSIANGLIL